MQDERYVVNANCSIALNSALEDVLQKGVPLYFLAEFELVKPRWYWAYRQMASWFDSSVRQEYRLSYNALTRKYRLARGQLQQGVAGAGQEVIADDRAQGLVPGRTGRVPDDRSGERLFHRGRPVEVEGDQLSAQHEHAQEERHDDDREDRGDARGPRRLQSAGVAADHEHTGGVFGVHPR